jgi:hypothetical protein
MFGDSRSKSPKKIKKYLTLAPDSSKRSTVAVIVDDPEGKKQVC